MTRRLTEAITAARGGAICAYLTGGYPTPSTFPELLTSVAAVADVVEIGVPFTDPMADGLTIQHSSEIALSNGVSLESIFEVLGDTALETPHLLMGYYNPFLAFGIERLVSEMARCQTSALIVPDLPIEEAGDLRAALHSEGLGIVQLVAPTTSLDRVQKLVNQSDGFVYAVASTGVTGGSTKFDQEALSYLDTIKTMSTLPVLAGFGVRTASQVAALGDHVDGVVVGSALIDAIDQGRDPGVFLNELRQVEVSA